MRAMWRGIWGRVGWGIALCRCCESAINKSHLLILRRFSLAFAPATELAELVPPVMITCLPRT